MTGIQSLPTESTFGTQFDYSVWGPGTEVTLCSVPWDSMYRDVYWFGGPEDAVSYIQRFNAERHLPTVSIDGLTYCGQNRPVRISLPFSEANVFNYLIVRNPSFPISQKNRATTFFYFITSVDYIAPETTQLTVSLDVWQTYHHLVDFRSAYIERSHQFEFRSQQYMDPAVYGRFIYYYNRFLRVPESIDLGQRMRIMKSYVASYLDPTPGSLANRFKFTAIIVSSVNLEGDWGSASNPNMSTAYGSNVKMSRAKDYIGQTDSGEGMRLVSGATYYSCPLEKLSDVMKSMSNYPWISQGIQDVYIVPTPNVAVQPASGAAGSAGLNKVVEVVGGSTCYAAQGIYPRKTCEWIEKEPKLVEALGTKGLAYLKRFAKFWGAPYIMYEVTANNGSSLVLDPMLVNSSAIEMLVEWHVLPPSPRIVMHVRALNSFRPTSTWKSDMEYVNESLVIDNFPHVPVVNDQSIMAYASNAHSIAQSRASAGWGRDKALRSAQNSFDQTMHGIRTSNAIMENNLGGQNLQTALANTAQMAHTQVANANRAINGIGGAIGTALTSPLAGIGKLGSYVQDQVSNDINTGIDINARNMGNVISQNVTRANQSEQNALVGSNAKANLDLANYAARGDYSNAIESINASVADTETVSPTIGSGVGGDAFNWVQNGAVLYTRLRMVDQAAIIRQGDMWSYFGYAVNRVMQRLPKRLQCMKRFSYWKCLDVRIATAACPQFFVETLRGILEKGVTVWHDPLKPGEYIDDVAIANEPIEWIKEFD